MGIKELIAGLTEKSRNRKAKFKEMEEEFRMQKMLQDRQKSSNERELEKFQNEDREENIKETLEFHRKRRDEDIRFGHNPLDTPNITNHTEWQVLKERNQFAGKGSMFSNQKNVLKNNPKLLNNNRRLFGI